MFQTIIKYKKWYLKRRGGEPDEEGLRGEQPGAQHMPRRDLTVPAAAILAQSTLSFAFVSLTLSGAVYANSKQEGHPSLKDMGTSL